MIKVLVVDDSFLMRKLISDILESGQIDGLLFDSLSTLLIYNKGETVSKFVHSVINKVKETGATAVFTALEGDTETKLLKEVGMFVDKVAKVKKEKEPEKPTKNKVAAAGSLAVLILVMCGYYLVAGGSFIRDTTAYSISELVSSKPGMLVSVIAILAAVFLVFNLWLVFKPVRKYSYSVMKFPKKKTKSKKK